LSRGANASGVRTASSRHRIAQPAPNSRPKGREPDPRFAFRSALGQYKVSALQAIRQTVGPPVEILATRATTLVDEITDILDRARDSAEAISGLPGAAAIIPSLFAITETTSISLAGLRHALAILGVEPDDVIVAMLERGLLAIEPAIELQPVEDLRGILSRCDPIRTSLHAHPSMIRAARTPRIALDLPGIPAGQVGQVRETDGLEPMLRLGALWQLVGAGPLRQTQQGTLYKRDQERLDENSVLNAASPDSPVEVADVSSLWLALAVRVGLVEIEATGDRLQACPQEFWAENSVHLHQMIATSWLGLRSWQELEAEEIEGDFPFPPLAIGYARLPILIRLGSLADGDWLAIEDLAESLCRVWPGWDRLSLLESPDPAARSRRTPGARKTKAAPETPATTTGIRILESVLLNAAFRMGLVRVGEEKLGRRRVVQLSPLGRYVLALGPPPTLGPVLEQFLFVQPNFELIAYRQGLTPRLIGRLSRFAHWSNIGAAIELKLTNESVVLGLDGGLTPDQIFDTLSRHSSRPLPTGVVDAVRSWAARRDRVTCHANATLIEFASRRELEQALELWPGDRDERSAPVAISDRLLLVEDDRTIPFDRLKLVGSRDYRHPPEICLSVDPDGIAMTLEPAKADLLVDAELSRFADEIVLPGKSSDRDNGSNGQTAALRRRYVVSSASLDRAIDAGMTEEHFADWYPRRTGQDLPPAIRLMLRSRLRKIPALQSARLLVVTTPSAEILDGLLQHPDTRDLFGERIGDTTITISEAQLTRLDAALRGLGIELGTELS
jgi:hypothetical protein